MSTHTIRTPHGTMAYTDVGEGAPVVFLHGNPTSARLYRHVIGRLRPQYRCIAPDYLGFGRSDAPRGFSYRPPAHATLIEALLRRLDLDDLTLVLHDWGGPIGLSYALRHPDTVRRLVLTNTWAWPLTHRPLVQMFSRLVGTRLGRVAIERVNAFPHLLMPTTMGPNTPLRPAWLRAYAEALDTPQRRYACWTLARSLIGETAWLRALWTRRARLRTRPALLVWGMADLAFGRASALRRWTALFPNASVRRLPKVGHYVPEERGAPLAATLRAFLRRTRP
jgi:haloalkane dehalogenase